MNDKILKILVVTSCAGEKKYTPVNIALPKDLDNLEKRLVKEQELEIYRTRASEMFISGQNIRILEGLSKLKENSLPVEIVYISSGYGLLESEDYVIPYDVTLSAMSKYDLDKRGDFLGLHQETSYKAKNYDLIFYFLSSEYLRVLKLPLEIPEDVRQIFFASSTDEKLVPTGKNIYTFFTGLEEANNLKVKQAELKGHIFQLICQNYIIDDKIFDKIYEEPSLIKDIVDKYSSKKTKKDDQLTLFD